MRCIDANAVVVGLGFVSFLLPWFWEIGKQRRYDNPVIFKLYRWTCIVVGCCWVSFIQGLIFGLVMSDNGDVFRLSFGFGALLLTVVAFLMGVTVSISAFLYKSDPPKL